MECQPRHLIPGQVEEGEKGGRGGVPKGKVPAIAGEVGPGEGGLGTSKEGSNLFFFFLNLELIVHCVSNKTSW